MLHEPSGCTSVDCVCELSLHAVIEAEIAYLREETALYWISRGVDVKEA